jgi:hypothetical protein
MATKNAPKKLRTSKETLRRLTSDLRIVRGGIGNTRCIPGDTCFALKA